MRLCMLALLLCVSSVRAGDLGGGWFTRDDQPDIIYLQNRGAYDQNAGKWCDYNPATCKYSDWRDELPGDIVLPDDNYGVDWDELSDGPVYKINGRECTRDECIDAIEGGEFPDYSNRALIVIIGPDADRAKARAIIGNPDWATVIEYAPDDWQVAYRGLVNTGKPTTYVMDRKGEVLHRQDDLDGLEDVISQYDPNADPDLRIRPRPNRPDSGDGFCWSSGTVGAGAGGLLGILLSFAWPAIRRAFAARTGLPPELLDELRELLKERREKQQKQ